MKGFAWGTVRLRMTLWNVAVLSFILGAMGGVVRYRVQADLLAMVDRTLAERARFEQDRALRDYLNPPLAGAPGASTTRRTIWPRLGAALAEGATLDGAPGALPPLEPRVLPRNPAKEPAGIPRDEPWDRDSLARSLDGHTVYSTIWTRGAPVGRLYPMRILSLPVDGQGKVDRVLQLAYPLDGVYREIDALSATLLALLPFGLLAAGLGGAFLAGRALRPVGEMASVAAWLGASDLSERLPVTGRDEFSGLSFSFNAMLARLEEAFDRQRRFTADASHELRTPLAIVKANTGLALERSWPEERYREFLIAIDAAATRQSRIVEELLFLARADAGKLARDMGPVCLLDVLEEAMEAVTRPGSPSLRVELIDPALLALGSGSELTRLFVNLLENAVRHTPSDGVVSVTASVDATGVLINVADNGEGIAPEHLPHLGERFYRIDGSRSVATGGNGLGLAICRSIVEAHGGSLTFSSELGRGTTVHVRLIRR